MGASACADLSEPPPPPADLSTAYRAYDQPSATLTDANLHAATAALQPLAPTARGLSGFSLLRVMINDSSTALSGKIEILSGFDIQGSVTAHLACTSATPTAAAAAASTGTPISVAGSGSVATASPVPSSTGTAKTTPSTAPASALGTVSMVFGVRDSKIERTIGGSMNGCRFAADGQSLSVGALTADLVVDMGDDLPIGKALQAPLLIRAQRLSGLSPELKNLLELSVQNYELRISTNNSLEFMVDLARLNLGTSGAVVAVFHADGSTSVRDRRGLWSCKSATAVCTMTQ